MTPTREFTVDATVHITGSITWDEPEPDDPFRLGVTEPTAAGAYTPAAVCLPRVPETSMRTYDGDLTNVAPGEVLDRLIVTGRFRPESSGWVLRDSIVEGGTPPAGESMWPLVDAREGAVHDGRVEFTELRPSTHGFNVYGFKGGNVDVVRSTIRGVVDGAQPHGSGTYPNNTNKGVRFRGVLVEDLRTFDDPGQSDGITHNDGLQAAGALDWFELVGCAIHGGRTSCVLLQQNQGTYRVVIVARNWLYGHPDEGSTFNTSQNGRGVICAGGYLIVAGNRFGRGNEPVALVAKSTLNAPTTLWVGNTYLDDGSPVEATAGAD
jgi:hypothetical protein